MTNLRIVITKPGYWKILLRTVSLEEYRRVERDLADVEGSLPRSGLVAFTTVDLTWE